ncbi:MAG: Rrf2 family transcriptional regulator [Phycisphaeraceae bacterium]|nr:Rrf2 family transcriptional regulator [Phycisphaeraceae bacterium]
MGWWLGGVVISQTVEYALIAMSFLASRKEESVTCAMISRNTRVPAGYLSKIMRDLVCAELVRSFRGPHGGFSLARGSETISLLEIVNAVEPIRRPESGPVEEPLRAAYRAVHQCLDGAVAQIERTFRQTTLSSVLACGDNSYSVVRDVLREQDALKGELNDAQN